MEGSGRDGQGVSERGRSSGSSSSSINHAMLFSAGGEFRVDVLREGGELGDAPVQRRAEDDLGIRMMVVMDKFIGC